MAKVFYRPACDAALLSAYRDEVLEPSQCRALELHLEACPACRQELLRYERLAYGLGLLAQEPRRRPISSAVFRSAAAPAVQRPVGATRALLSVSLAAVLITIALVLHAPQRGAAPFVAYPPSGASNVSTDTSILITFQHPVDQAKVQQTLQIEPQVPFDLSWQSWQQAEIIPLTPLTASTTYTLLAAVPPMSAVTPTTAPVRPSPTAATDLMPQTLTVFHTAPRTVAEGGPAPAIPRTDLFTRSQPLSASQPVLAVPATPSPVPLPRASAASSPPALQPAIGPAAQSPTSAADALAATLEQPALLPPCAPANIFTPVYSSRADVRTALGCVTGTTRTLTLHSQAFQRGILLAVYPDSLLYELTTDGIWQATPLDAGSNVDAPTDAAIGATFRAYWAGHPVLQNRLGPPLSAEDAGQALLQPFTHGFMLSAAGWIYIADDAGQWQRLVSPLPGDGSTPSDPGAITGGVPSFPPLRREGPHPAR